MALKLVFDSESDGLALEATRLWIVCMQDAETGETFEYEEGDNGWQKKLDDATMIIGHNIIEHDLPLFKKLTGWEPRKEVVLFDTLVFSRALDYKRFVDHNNPKPRHSQEAWGEYIGMPKQQHEDWSRFSEEMRMRCRTDVAGNVEMYKLLLAEFKEKAKTNEYLETYIDAEQAASKWVGMSHMNGWPFDKVAGEKLKVQLEEVVERAEKELLPKLGYRTVAKDKVPNTDGKEVEIKSAKWVASGAYHAHTASYFDVNPWSGYPGEEREVLGDFCRLEVKALQLSSTDDVKIFLNRNGWVPLEWNTKRNEQTKKMEQTSPKITEDSLEFLGGDGKLYREYSVASSRLSILRGWLDGVDEQGRLHGDCVTIGTPSLRARHSIIVNVPAMESKWGPEMRALFVTKPGWKLVGCDSAGNQGRGLAYYLNSKAYTNILINDDIHMYNAKALDAVLTEMGISWTNFLAKGTKSKGALKRFLERKGISDYDYYSSSRPKAVKAMWKQKRARAKRVYYSFLFGAGGAKVWLYCFGSPDQERGNKLKQGFGKKVPNFPKLEKALKNEFTATRNVNGTRKGYITSIGGVRVYVDSFHKLLVYLLQAFEKATCAAALMLWMQYMEEENIPYEPHIFMHDEGDCSVPEEYAERAAELGVKAFREGPKLFGVDIMDGSGKTGYNWKEIH